MDNLGSRIVLVCRLQAATHKFTSRSNFCPALLQSFSFSPGLVPLLVVHVSGLFGVTSNSSDSEKEKFFSTGRLASRDLPLSRTDRQM